MPFLSTVTQAFLSAVAKNLIQLIDSAVTQALIQQSHKPQFSTVTQAFSSPTSLDSADTQALFQKSHKHRSSSHKASHKHSAIT